MKPEVPIATVAAEPEVVPGAEVAVLTPAEPPAPRLPDSSR